MAGSIVGDPDPRGVAGKFGICVCNRSRNGGEDQLLLPAAAEGLVELDEGDEFIALGLGQG